MTSLKHCALLVIRLHLTAQVRGQRCIILQCHNALSMDWNLVRFESYDDKNGQENRKLWQDERGVHKFQPNFFSFVFNLEDRLCRFSPRKCPDVKVVCSYLGCPLMFEARMKFAWPFFSSNIVSPFFAYLFGAWFGIMLCCFECLFFRIPIF